MGNFWTLAQALNAKLQLNYYVSRAQYYMTIKSRGGAVDGR